MPLYIKSHSQGEYVFDHSWANAYMQAGGEYYPKLQCAVPFTPVTGPRLLAKIPDVKTALIRAATELCHEHNMSGLHVTFLQDEDLDILRGENLAIREDCQFHFINHGYQNFDDFLAALSSKKRKAIRRERREAQEGIYIQRLSGDDIKAKHWDVFYQCYLDTTQRKWGRPYLNREFFARIHETMRDDILLVMASADGTPVASALNFIGADTLYGRNWGALMHKPFLHFELCYYQAIEAGIEMGQSKVEAGAQGQHKLARGYEPTVTYSAHYLTHPGFMSAITDYLTRERRAVDHDISLLAEHTPFRKSTL